VVNHLGLRGRLILLVVLALTPAFGLLMWVRFDGARLRASEAEQRVLGNAELVAESQGSRDDAAEQLLTALIRNPALRNPGSPDCTAYLRDVIAAGINVYVNLNVISPDGVIVCGSDPVLGLRVADRNFFRRTVETRTFTVGELIKGRRTGRTLLNYALPVMDGDALRGVATASLNIEWVSDSLSRIPLVPGAGLAILDRTGSVIAKQPADGNWFADRLDAETLAAIQTSDRTHLVRRGPDGKSRHYALVWVGKRRDMFAVAGLLEEASIPSAAGGQFLAAVLVLLGGGGFALVIAFIFAKRYIHLPVAKILEGARRLETGDLTVRTSLGEGATELRELSEAFNRMAATLQDRERRARESQRLEAIGQLAGGLAHDFNNMLTVILGFSHSLQLSITDPQGRENINQIISAAERASNLTTQLLAFARRQVLQPRPMQVNDTISQVGGMLRQVIGEDVTMVTLLAPDAGVIQGDPSQIEQILLNLVLNARDAMPHGGTLRIETRNVTITPETAGSYTPVGDAPIAPGDYVIVAVSDTGYGMDPDTRARIFEPFFTTKGSRGTGLGLAMVYGITSQGGGFICCSSERGEGTTFTMLFPRIREEIVEGTAAPAREIHPSPGSETILVVEDEPSVRLLCERVLREAGYTVVTAEGAADAMDLVRHGVRPHLVLTDVVMPHMNGVALAESLRLMVPGAHVAYMSGHVEHAVLKASRIAPRAFLRKPFTPTALLRMVRGVLDAAGV
jgi:signal transduction histidine kinase/CheY-like chemotaxis protein